MLLHPLREDPSPHFSGANRSAPARRPWSRAGALKERGSSRSSTRPRSSERDSRPPRVERRPDGCRAS
jgi:hypothetical protein